MLGRQAQEAKQETEARAKAAGKSVTVNHYYPRFLPKRFNTTYRAKIGIGDSRKDFYSFRHTFKSALKNAGVEKELRDALAGHTEKTPGRGYEHVDVPIAKLKVAIEKLRFDGLEWGRAAE